MNSNLLDVLDGRNEKWFWGRDIKIMNRTNNEPHQRKEEQGNDLAAGTCHNEIVK